jgi:hypothetical protein
VRKIVASIISLSFTLTLLRATEAVPQPSSGYGANGPYARATIKMANPIDGKQTVYIFYPKGQEATLPAPTVFFSHAFATPNPDHYREFIDHLTSRGICVVYSSYPTLGASHDQRYEILWRGFVEAQAQHPELIDATRCGFVGHSFGGGATPRMALRGFRDMGWGAKASFMMTMAPWYSYQVTDRDLADLPATVKFLSVVYADDDINDARMAVDIFEHTPSIAPSDKAFLVLQSDRGPSAILEANHQVPFGALQRKGEIDALDYYGTWQKLDALIGYAINGDPEAKAIALGEGASAQRYMGTYRNGEAVKEALVQEDPIPLKPQAFYKYPWDSADNPRP